MGVSYVNYRTSPAMDPDEQTVAIDDENRDLDRFVVCRIIIVGHEKVNS